MNWKKTFSVLTISLLLVVSSVTAKAEELDDKNQLSEVPAIEKTSSQKEKNDQSSEDSNQTLNDKEIVDEKNSTKVEVEKETEKTSTTEEIGPEEKMAPKALADADPRRTFNIDNWEVNTQHDGLLIIRGIKNKDIANVYIPSFVYTDGQDRRVQFNDLSMFINSSKQYKFQSIIFEEVGPSANPTATQKIILGEPGHENINLNKVFAYHPVLKYADLRGIDTSKVTNMNGVFTDSFDLNYIDVSNWNTSNVTTMSAMFQNTLSLNSIDLSKWDTSKVTDMSQIFRKSGLRKLNLDGWNTSNVTSLEGAFSVMNNLTEITFNGWDTSKVTNFSSTFAYTSAIKT